METQHRKKRQRTTGPSFILPPAKKSRTDVTVELLSQILKELKDQRQLIEDLAVNQQKLQRDQDAIRSTVSEISKAMGLQETPSRLVQPPQARARGR